MRLTVIQFHRKPGNTSLSTRLRTSLTPTLSWFKFPLKLLPSYRNLNRKYRTIKLNLEPRSPYSCTLFPEPYTISLNPYPQPLNPNPSTLHPEPKPSSLSPDLYNPQPRPLQKPYIQNHRNNLKVQGSRIKTWGSQPKSGS